MAQVFLGYIDYQQFVLIILSENRIIRVLLLFPLWLPHNRAFQEEQTYICVDNTV